MEGITGCKFKDVWFKGKLELERYVIGHSQDLVVPLTPHPMYYKQFTCFDSLHCSFCVDLQNLNLHQYSNINVILESHYDSVLSASFFFVTRAHS